MRKGRAADKNTMNYLKLVQKTILELRAAGIEKNTIQYLFGLCLRQFITRSCRGGAGKEKFIENKIAPGSFIF